LLLFVERRRTKKAQKLDSIIPANANVCASCFESKHHPGNLSGLQVCGYAMLGTSEKPMKGATFFGTDV
jgi:hypothetical protein